MREKGSFLAAQPKACRCSRVAVVKAGNQEAAHGPPGMGLGCSPLSAHTALQQAGTGRAPAEQLRLKPQTSIPLYSGLSCSCGYRVCVFSDWIGIVGALPSSYLCDPTCMDTVQKLRVVSAAGSSDFPCLKVPALVTF